MLTPKLFPITLLLSLITTNPALAADKVLDSIRAYLNNDYAADHVRVLEQEDGIRVVEIEYGDNKGKLRFENLLAKVAAPKPDCEGSGYFVNLTAEKDRYLEIAEFGRKEVGGEQCPGKFNRSTRVKWVKEKLFVEKFLNSSEYLGGQPSLLVTYDLAARKVTRLVNNMDSQNKTFAIPKACAVELSALDRLQAAGFLDPIGTIAACEIAPVSFSEKESQVIYTTLEISKKLAIPGLFCSSDGGENRDQYGVHGLYDCNQNGIGSESIPEAAITAIRKALIRAKRELNWEKQDSLGSNRFWGGIRVVSCVSDKKCWMALD